MVWKPKWFQGLWTPISEPWADEVLFLESKTPRCPKSRRGAQVLDESLGFQDSPRYLSFFRGVMHSNVCGHVNVLYFPSMVLGEEHDDSLWEFKESETRGSEIGGNQQQ